MGIITPAFVAAWDEPCSGSGADVELRPHAKGQPLPTGTIEGVLCRGQIEVRRLQWTPSGLEFVLKSGKNQTVVLEVPSRIAAIAAEGEGSRVAKADAANQRSVTLPAGREVTVKVA